MGGMPQNMGQTLAEKILSGRAGKPVKAGEIAVAEVDVALIQDGTGPLAVRQMRAMGFPAPRRPERTLVFLDHALPSPRRELATDHVFLRQFARETGSSLIENGYGICHQVTAQAPAVMERAAAISRLLVAWPQPRKVP